MGLHQDVVELGGYRCILPSWQSAELLCGWIEKELIATQKQKWMLGERRTRLAFFFKIGYDCMTGVYTHL